MLGGHQEGSCLATATGKPLLLAVLALQVVNAVHLEKSSPLLLLVVRRARFRMAMFREEHPELSGLKPPPQ